MVAVLAAVVLLTSIVIVDAEEQAVVERFGRLVERPGTVLSSGAQLKWPYPVDLVYRAPVKRISELVIGETSEDEEDEHGHGHQDEAILWTKKHAYLPHLMLLVSSPATESASAAAQLTARLRGAETGRNESVPVSLLMVSVPIEYRIKDIAKYLHNYSEPVRLLEAVAHRFISLYATEVDIDELMGPGREAFNSHLKQQIQQRAG